MEIFQSIILGFVQGASEFLPISSSGHLIIIPEIFRWRDQGLAFDVALHWGTLFAVVGYFWKEWIDIIKKSYLINKILNPKSQTPNNIQSPIIVEDKHPISNIQYLVNDRLFIIIIATIPGVVSGLLLNNYAETVFRNPLLVSFTLLSGALLLFYSDKIGAKKENFGSLTLKTGFIIGLAQAIAIVPGVSRSGITITAALLLGFDRTSAARFSFLLSAPIILGAGIKEFPGLMENGIGLNLIAGAFAAALSGFWAIKYMLRYLEKASYDIFVAYRIVLAAVIIILFVF